MMDMLADFRMIDRCFITMQRVVLVFLILMSTSLNQAFADTAKNSAAECFKRAEQYEKEANKYANDVRDPSKWFELAMKNYLCASKAGNHLASWKVVELSFTDNVDPLPKEMVDRLLLEAAEADIPDAQLRLAYDYCNNVGTRSLCENPKEGEKWLLRAAGNGSAEGAFSLGHFYEEELSGEDTARKIKALACYKLSLLRYQEAMNAKGSKDLHQLKSDMERSKSNVEGALRKFGGKDPLGKCY